MPVQGLPQGSSVPLHPASLIMIWLAFALCIPWLRTADLAVMAALFSIPLLIRRSPEFLKLLRRTRWLMISLVLVYAFATPGAAALPLLGAYGPSREGLLSGGLQALRLVALLAGLAVLLAAMPRNRILAGLYFLFRPLARAGVDVDRAAARIWLTLHYAEQTKPGRSGEWRTYLRSAFEGGDDARQTIRLEVGRFFWPDYLILLCAVLALAFLLLRGGA